MKNKKKKEEKINLTKIKVIGIGGAGGKIISRMSGKGKIRGVDFIAINTDAQDLKHINIGKKIYIGQRITKGLGAGMDPEIGRQAAEENREEIKQVLDGADIIFVTAGLGGGTGSFGSEVVAETAKELGALTVGVVTKPFSFEGIQRSRIAEEALARLKNQVDTLIVVPNDHILNFINKDTSLLKAFGFVDGILKNIVQSITEIIVSSGLINLDFADIRAVMKEGGQALIGIGFASGEDRASKAVNLAINSPLLETSVEGAKGVLFSVSGGRDLKMKEIETVAKIISENVDPGAKIIFGAYFEKQTRPQLKVTLIATNLNLGASFQRPASLLFDFKTKKLEEEKEKLAKEETEEKIEEKKMEIPSFLRRKKGKKET